MKCTIEILDNRVQIVNKKITREPYTCQIMKIRAKIVPSGLQQTYHHGTGC